MKNLKINASELDDLRTAVYEALTHWRNAAAEAHAEGGPDRCWVDNIVDDYHRLYDRLITL